MTSTGNDIVARALIDHERSNDIRFYRKIISPEEQELFHQSAGQELSFETFLWLCWSVKESAYKYWKRHQPALLFSPIKVVVTTIQKNNGKSLSAAQTEWTGTCVLEKETLRFKTIVHSEYIASMVNYDTREGKLFWATRKCDSPDHAEQSAAVRRLLLDQLSVCWPDKKRLSIHKSEQGYPVLMDGITLLDVPVSFAHHGLYVSCSFVAGAHMEIPGTTNISGA